MLKKKKPPAVARRRESHKASGYIIASPKAKRWQLQEAKAKFSEVFEKALTEGPQVVSRRDKDEVVVMRRSDYDRQQGEPAHIVDLLLAAPRVPDFKIERDGRTGREPPKLD